MIKEGHSYKSKHNDLELKLLQLEEPNYGRMQYVFSFKVDGKNFFNGSITEYSRIIPNLDGFTFESADGRFVMIPLTSKFVLFEYQTKAIKELPSSSVAPNNSFVMNSFNDEFLVIVYQREINMVHLNLFNSVSVAFPFGEYQLQSAFRKKQRLIVTFKDLKDYKVHTKELSLNEMTFVD